MREYEFVTEHNSAESGPGKLLYCRFVHRLRTSSLVDAVLLHIRKIDRKNFGPYDLVEVQVARQELTTMKGPMARTDRRTIKVRLHPDFAPRVED